MVSDISGNEGANVIVVVRQHPSIQQAKSLDLTPEEVASIKEITDLVILEVKTEETGPSREVYVRLADFNKLSEDMPGVLERARFTRGRRPGSVNGA
jgi:hypothetical protein